MVSSTATRNSDDRLNHRRHRLSVDLGTAWLPYGDGASHEFGRHHDANIHANRHDRHHAADRPGADHGGHRDDHPITLNWAAATDNVGVAGYRLYSYTPAYTTGHSGKGGGGACHPAVYTLIVNNISPSTLSYTVTGLNPDTLHYYALAAFDAAGNQYRLFRRCQRHYFALPAMEWYFNSYYNTPISIVANHPLSFSMSFSAGNPTPTMSLTSEPTGRSYVAERR